MNKLNNIIKAHNYRQIYQFSGKISPQNPYFDKSELVSRLLNHKEQSKLSYDQISERLGLTNIFTAQLFHNQVPLTQNTQVELRKVFPTISEEDINHMMKAPNRNWDELVMQEPLVYRLYEAVGQNANALKAVINEKFGDGIMSAIDFYISVDKVKGVKGEDRVVVTMNGKFLEYSEQFTKDDTSK